MPREGGCQEIDVCIRHFSFVVPAEAGTQEFQTLALSPALAGATIRELVRYDYSLAGGIHGTVLRISLGPRFRARVWTHLVAWLMVVLAKAGTQGYR